MGSSSPRFFRMFCLTCGGTAGLLANSDRGSPGANARIVNTTILIAINVGTAIMTRRTIYLVIELASPALPFGDWIRRSAARPSSKRRRPGHRFHRQFLRGRAESAPSTDRRTGSTENVAVQDSG